LRAAFYKRGVPHKTLRILCDAFHIEFGRPRPSPRTPRIFGTLIGVLIIAVIQNGMNLTGVESYSQKVVLGLVILGAVLLDMLKRRDWRAVFRKQFQKLHLWHPSLRHELRRRLR
jgi:hypothetical protein